MKNMKFWRTALVASLVLTVMLSVTGGTIAWFTDTVATANNTIQSGNLDIVLEVGTLMDGVTGDATADPASYTWTEVTKETKLFKDYALYEPGYVETVAFRVRNNGNLALKYNLGTVITSETKGVNKEGTEFALSDHLKVVVSNSLSYASSGRNILMGWAENELTLNGMSGGYADDLDTDLITDQAMDPGDQKLYTMAIVMPTIVGNEANHNGKNIPQIDFGVRLVATQYTSEEDSFGSDYDKDAKYPTDLPTANVRYMSEDELSAITYTPQNTNPSVSRDIDVGYVFKTTETYDEAQLSPYAKWHADFVVTLDKEVPADCVGLAGSYESWQNGTWTGYDLTQDIIDAATGTNGGNLPANTEFRLLQSFGVTMSYEELCLMVEEFKCGAYAFGDAAKGANITVELRLYEVEQPSAENGNSWNVEVEPKNYETISKHVYTFE